MIESAFEIAKYNFSENGLSDINSNHYAKNCWPLVYILSCNNKNMAYIGESTDACTRMATHLNSESKNSLDSVHLITSEKFNKSAALDIESNLIRYMAADGKFDLLNSNLGLANHNYYQKAELYWGIFTRVWDDLRSKGVAKSSLESIDNSDVFKYSPYKSLSAEQEHGLQTILRSLLDDSASRILVEGGAGTGKTILAIFLFKMLTSEQSLVNQPLHDANLSTLQGLVDEVTAKYPNPTMALVVPMSSFRKTLQKVFRNIKGLSAKMVIGPAEVVKKQYDILLVDESHRLRQRVNLGAYFGGFDKACSALNFDKNSCTELDWILKQSNVTILFYDHDQSIKPSDVPKQAFDELKHDEKTKIVSLKSQFRAKGGNGYVRFVDRLLNNGLQGQAAYQSKQYELKLFDSLADMVDEIQQRNSEYGLSRLIAGYAWKWISKNDENAFDIVIDDVQLKWNSTSLDWINAEDSVNEVGCIHTTQGYDLNYSGIIFGHEIGYDPITQEIVIYEDNYFDKNGKNSIKDPKELKTFILNIYKTILLRGIKGTYIYACDAHLRDYLAQYVPLATPVIASNNIDTLPIDQVRPFENAIPLYALDAAAGGFSEPQTIEDVDWIALPDEQKPSKDLFACRVVGESMNRVITDGSICLFKKDSGGSRNGKIVLVEHTNIYDEETGSCYTIKEYQSQKAEKGDSWRHESICLKPVSNNPEYQELILTGDQVDQVRVVGIFVKVLGKK
ncbi:MAG: DUF2075 domain-containing protein [Gammaproteobacteria bacterium]|nr:DUF2075 domain-containing protein [Gammaproteobacteria bacterium]